MIPTTPVPAGRRRPTRWGSVALLAGGAGLVASPEVFPAPLQGILLALLVFLGPGAVLRNWIPVPPFIAGVLVPAVGVATVILLTTVMAALDLWQPTTLLVGLSLLVTAGGLTRWTSAVARRRAKATLEVQR